MRSRLDVLNDAPRPKALALSLASLTRRTSTDKNISMSLILVSARRLDRPHLQHAHAPREDRATMSLNFNSPWTLPDHCHEAVPN